MTYTPHPISELTTPCCIVNRQKMLANIERLANHIQGLGCQLRPHVKTHKSIEVTRAIVQGGGVSGITVSTLKEAQYFFDHGYTDILYAVGIVPNKLQQVCDLIKQGCDLKVVLDNAAMADLVINKLNELDGKVKVMIELDTDGHRSGIDPKEDELTHVVTKLHHSPNIDFIGVMTHAGESYTCFSHEAQLAMARQERDLSLLAAERIRALDIPCPVVSIGSTPTAFAIDDLTGITEVRAGVYVFFDLVMAGLNVCSNDDIAMSVLASVIGYQQDKHWVITDGGWMAMSRDRGTQSQPIDQGYGLVRDEIGKSMGDYIVASANQEHGIIQHREPESALDFDRFPLASMVQVLPNHACSTAAQFDSFYVVEEGQVIDQWQSISGW